MRPTNRRLALAAIALAVVAASPAVADASVDGPSVIHQGWTRTTPIVTFTPQAGEIYAATSVGVEQARAFIELDLGDVDPQDAHLGLTLMQAGDGLLPEQATLMVCPATGELAGDDELSVAPVADCSTHASATRSTTGVWS